MLLTMLKQFSQTNLALGSDVTLTVVCEAAETRVDDLFKQLWQVIYRFERQFSRFLPQSELSVFNRSAGLKQPITPEFRDILQVARQLSQETDGLFNPFVLPALQRAGYTKSFAEGYGNDRHDDHSARQVVPPDELELGEAWAAIPFGTALDLGGCGKGYLADRLADHFVPDWVHGFWFSMGGDVVGAGHDDTDQPWTVSIYSDVELGTDSPWSIRTSSGKFAAATSSTGVRAGTQNGKPWHHIIDPRTQAPAVSDLNLATVYTPSAVRADVLASCAIILGSQAAVPFLKARGVDAALLQGGKPQNALMTKFGDALRHNLHKSHDEAVSHA